MNVNREAVLAAMGFGVREQPPPHPPRESYLFKGDVLRIYRTFVLPVIKNPSMRSFTDPQLYAVQCQLLDLYLPGAAGGRMRPCDYNQAILWGEEAINSKMGTVHTKTVKRCVRKYFLYFFSCFCKLFSMYLPSVTTVHAFTQN